MKPTLPRVLFETFVCSLVGIALGAMLAWGF
jgi:hypothetical protein